MSSEHYEYYKGTRRGKKLFYELVRPYGFTPQNLKVYTTSKWMMHNNFYEPIDVNDVSTLHGGFSSCDYAPDPYWIRFHLDGQGQKVDYERFVHMPIVMRVMYPYRLDDFLKEEFKRRTQTERRASGLPEATDCELDLEWSKVQYQQNSEKMRDIFVHDLGMIVFSYQRPTLRGMGYNIISYADEFTRFIKGEPMGRKRKMHLHMIEDIIDRQKNFARHMKNCKGPNVMRTIT